MLCDEFCLPDTAKPDVSYKLHSSRKHNPDAREQTLLLFLFLGYSDPFQDQPGYSFCIVPLPVHYYKHLCIIARLGSHVLEQGSFWSMARGAAERFMETQLIENALKACFSLNTMGLGQIMPHNPASHKTERTNNLKLSLRLF